MSTVPTESLGSSRIVVGEVFRIDEHRLVLGDGTEIAAAEGIALPAVRPRTTVIVSCAVVDGQRVGQRFTILDDPIARARPTINGVRFACQHCGASLPPTEAVVFVRGPFLLHSACASAVLSV